MTRCKNIELHAPQYKRDARAPNLPTEGRNRDDLHFLQALPATMFVNARSEARIKKATNTQPYRQVVDVCWFTQYN